jgi:hypothetical protein
MSLEEAFASGTGILEWTGVNAPTSSGGPATTTSGFSGLDGTVMLAISFDHAVTIQVSGSGTSFVVHNASAVTQTGVIWVQHAPAQTTPL